MCRGSCLRRNDGNKSRNDGCRWVSGVGGMRERRVGLVGRGPHPSEFEGLYMGEFSGGMDSCLRRNDGKGGVFRVGVAGWRGVGRPPARTSRASAGAATPRRGSPSP